MRKRELMKSVRSSSPHLAGIEPYDPKYLAAEVMASANESPYPLPDNIKKLIGERLKGIVLNRYPDPLANDLRDLIAQTNGLKRDQVLIGNGGDELLFNLALAWGGPNRTYLHLPPTFSVYVNNAQITHTAIETIPRRANFTIDEEAVIERMANNDIDYTIVTSPNNPTGQQESLAFIRALLDATDALVLVDEAYVEFARTSVLPLLAEYENLVILRTFSKAYGLAGLRIGYLLGNEQVLTAFKCVRQPYSVDAISQAIACVVYQNRSSFEREIKETVEQRSWLEQKLTAFGGITVFPSEANFLLVRVKNAGTIWKRLWENGVLVRDFSQAPYLTDCLRITVGTHAENKRLLTTLHSVLNA